ncbi:hypothetical protein PENTCL1PPCAC_12875, partial [Pristionchus entomophagus]
IADFGLSRSLAVSPYYTTHKDCFPKAHTAPEAFVLEGALWEVGRVTRAADVWSYGVVLWELYSNGEDPYGDIAGSTIFQLLTEEGYRLQSPTDCPTIIYEKMCECWRIEPTARPTFDQIVAFLNAHELQLTDATEEERPTFCMSDCKLRDEKLIDGTLSLSAEAAGRRYLKSARDDVGYLRVDSKSDWAAHMAQGPACERDQWYIEHHHNGLIRLKCMFANQHESTGAFIPSPERFLRAKSNGSVELTDTPTVIDKWKPVKHEDGSWSLQSAHSTWLSACGDGSIAAVLHPLNEASRFRLESWTEPLVTKSAAAEFSGERSFKFHHGMFLRAIRPYGEWTVDLAWCCRAGEHWYVEEQEGKVSLRSRFCSNRYLSAALDGSMNTVDERGAAELWTPVKHADGLWSLQSAHGGWLSSREEKVVGTVDECGPWAHFTLESFTGPLVPCSVTAEASGRRLLKSIHETYLRGGDVRGQWVVDMGPTGNTEEAKWIIEDHCGHVALRTGEGVAHAIADKGAPLMPGRYLIAYDNGSVYFSDRARKDVELWRPYKNEDGTWSLLSIYHTWLSARFDGNVCTMTTRSKRECFWFEWW